MSIQSVLEPTNWLSTKGGPRYLQLQRRFEKAIKERALPPGTPLPPEREIAAITGLSRVTVRKAVAPLVQQGLIVQKRGSGTVVATPLERVEQPLSRLTSFTEDMNRRGMTTEAKWLARGVFMPSPEEIMTLGLGADQSVSRLERLRFAGGMPMVIERAALPSDILPDPFLVGRSLYDTLDSLGVKPVKAIQRISAANMKATDAKFLQVEEGLASLQIVRISYLPSGRAVELTKSVYRGDAYDFVAELKLTEAQAIEDVS